MCPSPLNSNLRPDEYSGIKHIIQFSQNFQKVFLYITLIFQTAKHYGNLGRLYQSMEQCSKAEEMHLKAIHIKEELLGKDDYEVALSVGHLARSVNLPSKKPIFVES